MAVSGCDFVCDNEKCQHKGSGIVITTPWPLGNIDKVIRSQKVSQNSQLKTWLEELKKQGRKYACISLPDSDKIAVLGYRVHMWCEKCVCDWHYDAMIPQDYLSTDGGPTEMEVAIKNANIPESCPTCNQKFKTFSELIDEKGEGIQCTSCHTKLKNNVWFCNEEGANR